MEKEKISRIDELIKKYNIDIEELKQEQINLAKQLEIKDKIDFSLADKFAGVRTIFVNNKLLCCIIVCDKDYEIVDKSYVFEKIKFPYIPGFRAYRELPAMVMAFEKLNEKPDVVFVPALGITHPRLGLASHFGLSTGVPTIGISDSLIGCEVKKDKDGEDILKKGKKVGKVLTTKPNSKPMYVSPGNKISVDKAYELCKSMINLPHKRPEPLHLAGKYAKEVSRELEGS